jgi:hypothetical protein
VSQSRSCLRSSVLVHAEDATLFGATHSHQKWHIANDNPSNSDCRLGNHDVANKLGRFVPDIVKI